VAFPILLCTELLWTAPELLRDINKLGTQAGDVYSFGVICSELVNRETVWNGVNREDEIEGAFI
jgi:serine/threonine protein kinase